MIHKTLAILTFSVCALALLLLWGVVLAVITLQDGKLAKHG